MFCYKSCWAVAEELGVGRTQIMNIIKRKSEILDDFIKKFNPKGVILSGGPDTATLNDSARAPQIVFDLGLLHFGCHGGLDGCLRAF
jgi:GMP synthase-like glutamine amidotransferase